MIKLKTYVVPTNLYVVGSNINEKEENEEFTVLITDDYCSGLVKSDKGSDYRIETEGSMLLLTEEQFTEAIKTVIEGDFSEETGVIEFKDFVGEVWVKLIDDDGKECLKENADLKEHLVHEYREDLDNEWRDVQLFFVGYYTSSQEKELQNYF